MANHPPYNPGDRPYSMSASLISDDPDESENADGVPVPRDGWSAAWHAVRKHWHHHRHSVMVAFILLGCFALVMCIFTTQGAFVAQTAAPQRTWHMVPRLSVVNTSEFQAFVGPLAQMNLNAQTWPRAQPIAGWQLAGNLLGFVGSVQGSMHALTYVDLDFNNTQQVVIAFRGVNSADTLDGLADRCADFLLWYGGYKKDGNFDFAFECQEKFNYRTLGYYSQAVDHTKSVLAAYPGASILLTGHGMGAGLALLVSSSNLSPITGPMPVVAFSAPSVGHAMEARNLKMWKDESRLAYIIGDRWDREMSSTTDDRMKGHVCAYETAQPDSCARCEAEQAAATDHRHRRLLHESASNVVVTEPLVSPDCKDCSSRTHDLNHVMDLVTSQQRPYCT